MNAKEFSVTRSHVTWKPRISDADIPFYRCGTCASTFAGIQGGNGACYSGSGRSLVAEPPYRRVTPPACCGEPMAPVETISMNELPDSVSLDYRFEGGFNNNCLKIFWNCDDAHPLEWVCIKTFTGTQLKYVYPGKRAPLIFAFADEDAFCYCDKSPCEECKFRCKWGMVAYASIGNLGIVSMPLDRMETIGSIDHPERIR